MNLQQWLRREERSASWLARRLGVSPAAVWHWLNGAHPSLIHALAIELVTRGEVRARDLVDHDVVEEVLTRAPERNAARMARRNTARTPEHSA